VWRQNLSYFLVDCFALTWQNPRTWSVASLKYCTIIESSKRHLNHMKLSFLKSTEIFCLQILQCLLKGTVARDFLPSFFLNQSTPPRTLIHRPKPFRIWLRISRDNRFESRQNLFQRGQWPAETENEVQNSPTFSFKLQIWYKDIYLWNSFAGYSLLKNAADSKRRF
jgi:hypothetical protein